MAQAALKVPEGAKVEEPKKRLSLRAKLAAAMGEIGWVKKDGRNDAQRYNFTSAEGVADAVRSVLAKYGVDVEPDVTEWTVHESQTKSGGTMHYHRVMVAWTFTDADSDEKVGPLRFPGEGMDSGDKAVYKAMTGSLKYALRMKFLIPFGDDPEENGEHDGEVYSGGAGPSAPQSRTEAVKAKVAAQNGKGDRLAAIVQGLEALGLKTTAARTVKARQVLGHDFKPTDADDLAAMEKWIEAQRNINDAAEVLGGTVEN